MSVGPGHRRGPYVRLHLTILDEIDAAGLSPASVGVLISATIASARAERDGPFFVREVARGGMSKMLARRALVELEAAGFVRQIDREAWAVVGFAHDQMTSDEWARLRTKNADRKRKSRALAHERARLRRVS